GTSPVGPSGFHGTMVASLIAGQGRESGGVAGVAPDAKLLSVSIGLGLPDADTDRQIAQAVRWSVDNGAQIINLSISRNSVSWPASWDSAFLYAMDRGVLIIAASGNESQNLKSATAPATLPGVVSVTAVDEDNQTVAGAGSSGLGVSLAAPGVDLLGSFPGGDVRRWSGSSAAAPLVAGVAALILEKDPSASANDIIQRLISTTTDLGDSGFDGEYGWGLVSPAGALLATDKAQTNPLGSLADWIRLYRPQTAEDTADLVIPQEVGPLEAENDGNSTPTYSEVLSNPLLYVLLVPLALLLWFVYRNRLGRAGKKKPEGNSIS
ncbi:MAG: S8 family peptidase, partial [Aquiluna sp.]